MVYFNYFNCIRQLKKSARFSHVSDTTVTYFFITTFSLTSSTFTFSFTTSFLTSTFLTSFTSTFFSSTFTTFFSSLTLYLSSTTTSLISTFSPTLNPFLPRRRSSSRQLAVQEQVSVSFLSLMAQTQKQERRHSREFLVPSRMQPSGPNQPQVAV